MADFNFHNNPSTIPDEQCYPGNLNDVRYTLVWAVPKIQSNSLIGTVAHPFIDYSHYPWPLDGNYDFGLEGLPVTSAYKILRIKKGLMRKDSGYQVRIKGKFKFFKDYEFP